jgi:guanylate kinase
MSSDTGKVIIFSAPSGAGKTTLVHYLLSQPLKLAFSVSATSRPRRVSETHGEDYYFLSEEEFRSGIASGLFLEWEEVYPGQFYGTLKSEMDRIWKSGRHVIFDVDVMGGLNLKKHFGVQALSVFLLPPSLDALEVRLRRRGSETEDKLQMRLSKADKELALSDRFDEVIINKDLDEACFKAHQLVSAFLKGHE